MKIHELSPVAGSTFEASARAAATAAATARPAAAATRARRLVPVARFAQVSKAARCLWFAAFPSVASTTFLLSP